MQKLYLNKLDPIDDSIHSCMNYLEGSHSYYVKKSLRLAKLV